jgi:hypothetical protein
MGSGALAIALPFACILGLLAAVIASNVGKFNPFKTQLTVVAIVFAGIHMA